MNELVTIENEYLKTEISPLVGGSIFSMQYNLEGGWVDVMRPTPRKALAEKDVLSFASFNLFPYSNRIEDALLKFKGQEYQLEVTFDDGHAIHGEAWTRPWKVVEKEKERLLIEFDSSEYDDIPWPFPFKAEMEYLLEDNNLKINMSIENTGEQEMPAGMGIHPYFMRKLEGEREKINVKMDTLGIYPGETQIPSGHWIKTENSLDFTEGNELTTAFLDSCFRAGDEDIVIKWQESGLEVVMEKDEIFKHTVIYCPAEEKDFFAIEPVTNCNNGFNMAEEGIEDTGTVILEPGDYLKGTVNIKVQIIEK